MLGPHAKCQDRMKGVTASISEMSYDFIVLFDGPEYFSLRDFCLACILKLKDFHNKIIKIAEDILSH